MAESASNAPKPTSKFMPGPNRRQQWLRSVYAYTVLTFAAILSAVSVIVFLVPANIAPGGISGISIIMNELIGTPVGLVVLALNIPIMLIGYRMLGGWQVIRRTMYFIAVFSVLIDVLAPFFPPDGVTDNTLLNAIFSGVISGISGGIVLRVKATGGGTATLGRILQQKFGIPISSATLYTDTIVVVAAGVVFGWEAAMYAIISLIAYGTVTDYVLEGPSVIRTATIITNHPDELSNLIIHTLGRGVTSWQAEGMYTHLPHTVLFVTVIRSQVNELKDLVASADPDAFLVIGQGHVAYGRGFKHIHPPKEGEKV